MMNDTEIDLGEWKKNNRKIGAGAGANANSTVDMMNFVGSGTLAELVWSPETGLNVKFAEKKPCFMWEEGPSETRRLDTQNEATCHVSDEHGDADDIEMEKDGRCSDPFLENAEVAIFEDENDEKHETIRKRKRSFAQQLVLGRKRIKEQTDEYASKTDHTFMNWISNMSKGLKSHNIYDQRINVSDETGSLESKETGFQNVFQSFLSPETVTRIENKSIGSSGLANRFIQESLDHNTKKAEALVKRVSLYEEASKESPKGMFDSIRRLRLSRTDIHKWMNSQQPVTQLDGFFLRLRVAKWEEGSEGSRYYVGCITGLQWETPWKDLKQPIRVKVGGVECFVESQHISNCDFIEDELLAWWQKISENQRISVVKDLKSKLAVRRTLGM